MVTKTVAALAGVLGLFGTAYSTVWFLDGRYAPLAAVEDMAYSQLKKDIRELKDRIEKAEGPEKANLIADLEELLDRLCRNYESDRECKPRSE